jgi:uncharacterized circularly permuted ATP-grasp superfamily protein/uncharacterized alpha-E superfamily protein
MESLRGLTSSPEHAYDELVTGQKSIRYHWQGILSVIRALPGGGLSERVESARRQLEESGATLNLVDARGKLSWTFDPLPFVITPDEWSKLEAGLVQRASLLDAILADLYGPQTLLDERLVPPMLVHANRHFLRACRVTDGKPPGRYLGQYAVDLVRLSSGQWHVLADHTEVPSGAGFALEIRRVLARSLPEAFRSIPVRHVRSFVDRWHNSLAALAPHVSHPNMAVLTPGSLSATYFEHVYLSRALGVSLVEGGDLVARDGEVLIKTLAGLRPVHVLLRRLDSAFADPLELRADSALGVTGLVEATRSGKIALANALGSGLVETPALMPFLDRLSQRLLGQPLLLPSLDVWWLGEPSAYAFAMAHLDSMIVRPCLGQDREPIVVGMLEGEARRDLQQRIEASPGHFVAQYPVSPSLNPKWDGETLVPSAVVLRCFLVSDGGSWRVLPGGLAREPAGDTALSQLGRLNGTLKDVWVLAEDAADVQIPTSRRFHQLEVDRGSAELQSRVADNLYWLGRYVERLDNDARLLRLTVTRVAQGVVGVREGIELRLLGRLIDRAGLMPSQAALASPDSAAFQTGLAAVASEHGGLAAVLDAIQRLTGTLRDRFSPDMMITVGPLLNEVRGGLLSAGGNFDPLLAALDDIVRFVSTLSGLASENMTRGTGWLFLDLGRRIERAQFVLGAAIGLFQQSPIDWDAAMRLALELCDSSITYRWRYLGQLQPAPVLDLIGLDDSNPRAFAFQLRSISSHLDRLAEASGTRVPDLLASLDGDLARAVAMFDGEEKSWRHEGLALGVLREIASDGLLRLEELSEAITRAYFSHVPAAQAVGSTAMAAS